MHTLRTDEPCPDCGRFANRGVSVDAIIIRDGKILLIRRGGEPFKGYWATPGGFVDWDETVEDAVAREVMEEVGLRVTGLRFVGLYSQPSRHPNQVINAVFVVTADGDPVAGDDAAEFAWYPLDSLPSPLAFDHAQNIQDALTSRG